MKEARAKWSNISYAPESLQPVDYLLLYYNSTAFLQFSHQNPSEETPEISKEINHSPYDHFTSYK